MAVCVDRCGLVENPSRESCEGSFLQFFREQMRGLHDLLRQKLSFLYVLIIGVELKIKHLPDDAIPIPQFGGEDAGVMKLGVVSHADMFHPG
jgi:hypothetical protein